MFFLTFRQIAAKIKTCNEISQTSRAAILTSLATFRSDHFGARNWCSLPDHEEKKIAVKPYASMPGPWGLKQLPYVGTALMFRPFTPYSPETFGELIASLHEKYGHVFRTRLGRDFSVHSDNAEDAEAVFRADGAFPQRRLMNLSRVYRERNGLPPALGTVSGPAWQELRTAVNPLLIKPSVCLHYLPAQNLVADDLVRQLQNCELTPSDQSELFFKFAAESIAVVCFNQRLGFLDPLSGNDPEKWELLEAMKLCLHCTFVAMIGLERRYLRTADDEFYKSYEHAMKLIRKRAMIYVEKVMHESGSVDSENRSSDRESNLLESMLKKGSLDFEKILAIIDSMLIAGTDSTARNLTVLFYNLARNPEQQNKAATEVLQLVGKSGPVTPEALSKMSYVKACVKESMRVHFPLANGGERTLTSDTIIGGYMVPRGTSVIMSSRKSSLDPRYFPNPLRFLPERWLRESGDPALEGIAGSKSHPFACLPFGHGARGCIGRRFAEMEIYVATAKVLQKLHVEVEAGYGELKLIYTPFITPTSPIPFVFKERRMST